MSLGMTAVAPLLPKIEAALAHGPTDRMLVKMVLTVVAAASVIGAPIAGVLTDRYNRTPLIVWSTLLWALIGVSGYFIDDIRVMVGTRFLLGLAGVTVLTVGVTMIGDIADFAVRNRLMGIQLSISALSTVLVMPVVGVLGDIYWRLPFLLFVVVLPMTGVAYFGLGVLPPPRSDPTLVVSPATEKVAFPFPIFLMALGVLAGIITFIPYTYMPFELRGLGVASASKIALALAAQSVTTALIAPFFGSARNRMSSHSTFALSFALMGLGAGVNVVSDSYDVALLGMVLIGVGAAWLAPNLMTRASETIPEARGRTIGLVKAALVSAPFLGTLLLEPIFRTNGARGVLTSMLIMATLTALAFIGHILRSRVSRSATDARMPTRSTL
jgi:MFS family permease